jgi:septal ring factor EnvC (AmiA/AmiB activator)
MTAEVATHEKVQAAVEQLHRDGRKATADAVIALIGGGSKPTVLKHLQKLREAPTPSGEIPVALLDLVRPVLAQIYAQAIKDEQARTQDQVDRYHRLMGDLEAQVEELAAAGLAQEARIAKLTGKLTEAETALDDANGTIARQREEIDGLQSELTARNQQTTESLAGLLKGFEDKIIGITDQLEKVRADSKSPAQDPGSK